MGGHGSVPLPRYSCCIRQQNPNRCKENHSTPKVKGHRRNLSAAFNMADLAAGDFNTDKIDINRASEEELMTLPGINRITARNIVDYRRQIGGFKKVEDLALVSGVGATKLTHIRLEICVSGRKKTSQSSSRTSSRVDLSLQDDVSRASSNRPPQRANINVANVFQLMRVPGLSQTLAENIVAYRDKKGAYRALDDLVKVKGIKPAVLSALRPYLCLTDVPVYQNGHTRLPGHTRSLSQVQAPVTGPPPVSHSKTLSVFGSQEDLISLYGPLARKSFRSVKRPALLRRNNRHILRLGSWNLQRCGLDKADNPGVKEVVAMTTLENGISILAVQDLAHPDALGKLCEELNRPTVPNVKKWRDNVGSWRSVTSESVGGASQGYVGFLYDVSRGIECRSVALLDRCENRGRDLERRPWKAVFKVKDWEVCVVCVDWEPHQPDTVLDDLLEAVDEGTRENKDVIIVGSFDMAPTSKEFDMLRNHGYQSVFIPDNYTDITTQNPEGSRSSCNIWVNRSASRLYTDQRAVIREGLTSPWIPDGWGWGGVVSRHCPLWGEFYIDTNPPPPPQTVKRTDDSDDDDDDEFVDAQDKIL